MRRHSMLPSSSKPQVDAFTSSLTSDTVDEAFFSTLQASKQIAMGSIQSTLCVRRQEGHHTYPKPDSVRYSLAYSHTLLFIPSYSSRTLHEVSAATAAHLLRTSIAWFSPALGPGRGWRAEAALGPWSRGRRTDGRPQLTGSTKPAQVLCR